MLIGKIPANFLQEQILPFTGAARAEVLVGPKFGEDCAVLDLGGDLLVLSTDPITGTASGLGKLAIHVSCNDIAATGAEPVGLLLTFLFPQGTVEKAVEELVQEAHQVAGELNLAILGGHSEITAAVNQAVISATAVGRVKKEYLVTSSGAQAGDDVILTKWAGLEGTAILAVDKFHKLSSSLPPEVLQKAEAMGDHLSVIPEGITAARAGATAMHDVTEGGVRGALVELAAASGAGLEIWKEKIPLAPETEAICRILNIDPLGLISSGAMLITAPPGSSVMQALEEAKIPAGVIGKVTAGPELYLVHRGQKEKLTAPPRDELYEA